MARKPRYDVSELLRSERPKRGTIAQRASGAGYLHPATLLVGDDRHCGIITVRRHQKLEARDVSRGTHETEYPVPVCRRPSLLAQVKTADRSLLAPSIEASRDAQALARLTVWYYAIQVQVSTLPFGSVQRSPFFSRRTVQPPAQLNPHPY